MQSAEDWTAKNTPCRLAATARREGFLAFHVAMVTACRGHVRFSGFPLGRLSWRPVYF